MHSKHPTHNGYLRGKNHWVGTKRANDDDDDQAYFNPWWEQIETELIIVKFTEWYIPALLFIVYEVNSGKILL